MRRVSWGVTGVLFAIGIYLYFSSEQARLTENIYHQEQGYELTLIQEAFPVEFQFEEHWLNLVPGENREINKVLLTKENSSVILKKVFREESTEDYGVELDITHSFQDPKHGRFLSSRVIEKNSFTSNTAWDFYTMDGRELNSRLIVSGASYGPSELSAVRMSSTELDQLNTPFIIKWDLYLYQYDKN
ncbi:hypothetical protein [Bacillus sp. AK128]